jgi:hypothetical protein
MNQNNTNRPLIPLLVLSTCLLFLGINGLVGGYAMLSNPYDAPMGIPVSALERTPFRDFLIPGLLLTFVWGVGSIVTLIGLWERPRFPLFDRLSEWTHEFWAWGFSILMGVGLLVWLTVQVVTLPDVAPIQYILYALALLLIVLPLLTEMRQYYWVEDKPL